MTIRITINVSIILVFNLQSKLNGTQLSHDPSTAADWLRPPRTQFIPRDRYG